MTPVTLFPEERSFFCTLSRRLDWIPKRFRDRGMVFGTVQWLSELAIHHSIRKVFDANQKPLILRIMAKAVELLTSFAIAWALLATGGYPLTFIEALNITYVNILYSAASGILLDYLFTFPAICSCWETVKASPLFPKWILS